MSRLLDDGEFALFAGWKWTTYEGAMNAMTQAIVGGALGVGISVSVAIGYDAIVGKKTSGAMCFEIVTVKPDRQIAVTFNVCTGRFGISQLPPAMVPQPEPPPEGFQY